MGKIVCFNELCVKKKKVLSPNLPRTESAKGRRLLTKVRGDSLEPNQSWEHFLAENISIFISATEQMLKSTVWVAAFVNIIEVELIIDKVTVEYFSCDILLVFAALWAVINIVLQVFHSFPSHFQFPILSKTAQIRKLPNCNWIYTSRNCPRYVTNLVYFSIEFRFAVYTQVEKKNRNKTSLWSCLR